MRWCLFAVVALVACGRTPTGPTGPPSNDPPPPPIRTVEFRVLLTGLDNAPLARVPVTLVTNNQRFPATTDTAGLASWRVAPGDSVAVTIQTTSRPLEMSFPRPVTDDVEWGITIPFTF